MLADRVPPHFLDCCVHLAHSLGKGILQAVRSHYRAARLQRSDARGDTQLSQIDNACQNYDKYGNLSECESVISNQSSQSAESLSSLGRL